MNTLTTGIRSGLGKYIYETFGGMGLSRETSQDEKTQIQKTKFDVIIHCAVNTRSNVDSDTLGNYLEDNIYLTQELASLKHKKFIYFSSVYVYPRTPETHREDSIIDIDTLYRSASAHALYSVCKLASEAILKKHCKNLLILRPTTLLGIDSRKNSMLEIINNDECALGLSAKSNYNLVLHSDVLEFIRHAIDQDIQGVYNVAASDTISLSDTADLLDKKVEFGNHVYDVGQIDNSRISSIFPAFKKSSKENLIHFVTNKKHG